MSIFEKPPNYLIINNKKYNINSDFRIWIQFQNIILENIDEKTKITNIIDFLNKLNLPITELAIEKVLQFFQGGFNKNNKIKNSTNNKIAYDFSTDETLIYTAFLTQYKIDLTTVDLHWWNFKRLFSGLNENHLISKIMWARTVNINTLDKKTKEYVKKLKETYPIINNYKQKRILTAQEHYQSMINYVNKRFDEIKKKEEV